MVVVLAAGPQRNARRRTDIWSFRADVSRLDSFGAKGCNGDRVLSIQHLWWSDSERRSSIPHDGVSALQELRSRISLGIVDQYLAAAGSC